ncbi:MAG: 3-isopropylmalate dehydratase [Caldiserica bacterium]|nr:MAG: 3-isopropylmalate dehydratase [Caldisericota bacterium]
MNIKGRVVKLGDNIDTDIIIPARFLTEIDEKELGKYAFYPLKKEIKAGDIIVAGSNFGCGSSREHAPRAIKGRGIPVVIAKSFARIFYRNAINTGLPIIELEEADELKDGEIIEIDIRKGIIKGEKEIFKIKSFPEFMQDIINKGGLLRYIRRKR